MAIFTNKLTVEKSPCVSFCVSSINFPLAAFSDNLAFINSSLNCSASFALLKKYKNETILTDKLVAQWSQLFMGAFMLF